MDSINISISKRVFDVLAAALQPLPVFHSYPPALISLPCVTFYVDKIEPLCFADNGTYADLAVVTIDIWADVWEESEQIYDKLVGVMYDSGFCAVTALDNSSVNQNRRREVNARKTMKCRIIL